MTERTREVRRNVLLQAAVRADRNEFPASIHNYSSRGMMLSCARPPRRGEYLEIKTDGQNICARVVWSDGRRFGVRTREMVTLGLSPRGERRTDAPGTVRKLGDTGKAAMVPGAAVAASRAMQWAALAAVGVALAAALAMSVGNTLGAMSKKVNLALHQQSL